MYRRTPFHLAAKEGHKKICQFLIENLEDKCPKDLMGSTPLHNAAFYDQKSIIKLIMNKIAQKDPEDDLGRTPLHLAASNSRFSTCKVIIKHLTDKHDIICRYCQHIYQTQNREYVCHFTRDRFKL